MAELRQPSITKVTNNVQVRSRKVLISSYGAGKIHTGITMDGVDLDTYVQPGVARVSANYTHGPSIENQPGYIIVHAVNQDEERDKPADAVTEDSEDKKADTSSWKGRYRYRQLYFPDSGADNTPYTRTGSKDEPKDGAKDDGKITWGSWSSIAGSKIDQQLSSHEGRITILEMNTMMYSRHDFVTTQWVELKHNYKLIPSGYEGFNTIPEDIENSAPMMQLEQEVDPVSGEVKKTAESLLSDTNKKYTHTFVTNHYTHTHVYKFENSNAEGNNGQATHGNATGSVVLMDDKVEVHILGKTDTEDIQREMQIVAHEQFNGYIITMGAITPPEFKGRILKANQSYTWNSWPGYYTGTKIQDFQNEQAGEDGSKKYDNKYEMKWTDDVAIIDGIKRNPSNVSAIYVPATLDIDGKTYPVKIIAGNTVAGNSYITKIMVGEGIEWIDSGAFQHNSNVTEIVLPSTLKFMGGTFEGQPNCKDIVLPEGVKCIGSSFLYGLNNFVGPFKIPSTLEKIVFAQECHSTSNTFKGYTIAENNSHFKVVDECLYSADGKILYGVPDYAEYKHQWFTTPPGCKLVGSNVFYSNTCIKGLTFSEGVEYIGLTIQYMPNLRVMYLPSTLKDDCIFTNYACTLTKLAYITLGKSSESEGGGLYEVENHNTLYSKNHEKLLFLGQNKKYAIIKLNDSCNTVGQGAITGIHCCFFDLNNVETIEQTGINSLGNLGTEDTNTSSSKIYGLSFAFSSKLKCVRVRGLQTLRFNHYYMPHDSEHFEIQGNCLLLSKKKKEEDTETDFSNDPNAGLKKDQQRYITYLYHPPKSHWVDVELTMPKEIAETCKDESLTQQKLGNGAIGEVKKIDYSLADNYVRFGRIECASTHQQFEVIFPPKLKSITGVNAIVSNYIKKLEFPETLTCIGAQSFSLPGVTELIFHCKKKLGDKVEDEEMKKAGGSYAVVTANSVFTSINTACIIKGAKDSYAKFIADQYTLKFQELTEAEEQEYKKKIEEQKKSAEEQLKKGVAKVKSDDAETKSN